jgi:uncharacterized protein (TIGR01777 family)
MAERVAVTGATGLIGRAVVAELVARHHEVVVLARDPRQACEGVPGAADYVAYRQEQEAAGDATALSALLAGVDHVVNLAGASLFRPFTGRRYLHTVTQQRITGTQRLVAALRAAPAQARARTLVNASSVGIYGFGPPSDAEVDEDAAPLPGRYAAGSAVSEAAAAVADPETRVVLLRMGYVLAGDGGGLPYQLAQARKGKAAYFAPGTQWLPWIHRDDVVEFILRAVTEEHWRGAYNLVAPQQVRSREFAETLTRVVGSTPPRKSPALLARVFVGAGADILLGGRRVVPTRVGQAGYKFVHPNLEDALHACAAIR